jgi:hypothetical protein
VTTTVFLRCLVISLVASALPPFATLVVVVPTGGEPVVLDASAERVQSVQTRRLRGFERLGYMLLNRQWVPLYWPETLTTFASLLTATALVSVLNERDQTRDQV